MKRRTVAVVGATGAVGQKFLRLLDAHPWFRLTEVGASEKSAGKRYQDAVTWRESVSMPRSASDLVLKPPGARLEADIVFSALPSGLAAQEELRLAKAGHRVFTNARDLRMDSTVPLVIAEVNPDHMKLIDVQRRKRRTDGFVVANGNCTAVILSLALAPLHRKFKVKTVNVVTQQALSGAGFPGESALNVLENVVPFIPMEEEKVEQEPRKFLGTLTGARVRPAPFVISATCTRVPVLEGHTEHVAVTLERKPTAQGIIRAWESLSGPLQQLGLPSAPKQPLQFHPEPDRPQPRRDRELGRMMTVSVGRLRQDALGQWKFVATGSNTVRGAAGASILNAELALSKGYV